MSLAADRPLNWNLLGSLADTEIYEEQLRRVRRRRRARCPRRRARLAGHHAHARGSHCSRPCPGWRDVVRLVTPTGVGPRSPTRRRATPSRAGAAKAMTARRSACSSDWHADGGRPDDGGRRQRVGRSEPGRRLRPRGGTDVVDVLLDVVLPDPTGTLGRCCRRSRRRSVVRRGLGARAVEVWKDARVVLGGSDAGAHVDLMCHANYPTVVLGEVVRDRGLAHRSRRRCSMMTDRPGRALRAARPRPGAEDASHADLVVFDPATVASEPARVAARPSRRRRAPVRRVACGIDRVLVGRRRDRDRGRRRPMRAPGTVAPIRPAIPRR